MRSALGVMLAMVVLAGAPVLAGRTLAAFTGTTASSGNGVASGTVALGDDDSGAALFSVSSLVPGQSEQKCIVVTYSGSLAAAVKLYAEGYSSSRALGSYVNLVVQEGSGATFAGSGPSSCPGFSASGTVYSGTVDDFAATRTGYATGVGSFAPSGAGQSRVYRFSYTLDGAVPDGVQSGTASLQFVWQANST